MRPELAGWAIGGGDVPATMPGMSDHTDSMPTLLAKLDFFVNKSRAAVGDF